MKREFFSGWNVLVGNVFTHMNKVDEILSYVMMLVFLYSSIFLKTLPDSTRIVFAFAAGMCLVNYLTHSWTRSMLLTGNMPKGFPTHVKDVDGDVICLGDTIQYDYEDEVGSEFEVVFEEGAFRKKYKKWDASLQRPVLDSVLRLKIIRRALEL